VFALPYRMLFAVATMDTIVIHDTQQAGPICLLTKLHYDEFTDMSWLVFHPPRLVRLRLNHVP
jgi:chromatin assembly factor 1 subunit B